MRTRRMASLDRSAAHTTAAFPQKPTPRPSAHPAAQLIGWGMIQTGTRLTIGADGNTVPITVGSAAE